MVLNDNEIKRLIKTKDLVTSFNSKGIIEPLSDDAIESGLQPASFDVRLGDSIIEVRPNDFYNYGRYPLIDVTKEIGYSTFKINQDGTFILSPHSFALATTKEVIKLPNDLTAFVEGRSSIGRLGLFIQNAGWVDPGFIGEITLELYNATNYPIQIKKGMRIAQLVFCKMNSECDLPYVGKYQHQKGATASRINEDKDLKRG